MPLDVASFAPSITTVLLFILGLLLGGYAMIRYQSRQRDKRRQEAMTAFANLWHQKHHEFRQKVTVLENELDQNLMQLVEQMRLPENESIPQELRNTPRPTVVPKTTTVATTETPPKRN